MAPMIYQGFAATINNYTADDLGRLILSPGADCSAVETILKKKKIRVSIFFEPEEAPTTGTRHIQIFGYLAPGMTKLQIQRLFCPDNYRRCWVGTDWPAADKGPTYGQTYCSKDGQGQSLVNGEPITDEEYKSWWENRPVPAQGKRTDLSLVKDRMDAGEDIQEIVSTDVGAFSAGAKHLQFFMQYQGFKRRRTGFSMPSVEVFWGTTGTGKTRKAYELCGYDLTDTWRWTPGCGTTFFDGYCGQENVIFDEFRGQIPLGQVLSLTDGYPMTVQIKGSSVHWSPSKIIFTSPMHPREWYTSVGTDKIDQLLRRIEKVTEFKRLVVQSTGSA